jgi:hypothetical protein
MKKYSLLVLLLLLRFAAMACPACEKQQPKILRGITHGTGPERQWDYVIVWAAVIVVVLTLFYSIKWLIRPGETASSHIKQFILND